MANSITPLRWNGDALELLDQLALPLEETWISCRSCADVAAAIANMTVRGAPAIGVAAAYGVALAAMELVVDGADRERFKSGIDEACAQLAATRPTAVNLAWAVGEMRRLVERELAAGDPAHVARACVDRAQAIQREDEAMCRAIGKHGAALLPDSGTVLTHCNAGALATAGYGTALGVVRAAREAGKTISVIADETRPYLQGARLTAWELMRDGFDVTLIPDGAAAFTLWRGAAQAVVVGADRIARNGDVANKIGTYGVALAARRAGVPFYVAAPTSTIDRSTARGDDIPIEERSADELVRIGDTLIAPPGVRASYPAFDVTPHDLVDAIITEHGVARAPYEESLRAFVELSEA